MRPAGGSAGPGTLYLVDGNAPVPPRLPRHPRPGHQPRPAHERHLRLHHHAAQARARTRSPTHIGDPLRPAGDARSATSSTPSTRPTGREDGRRPRGAASLRAPGVRGAADADPRGARLRGRRRRSPPSPDRRWQKGWRVVVVSGDKDLLQLVSDEVTVLNPGREGMGADALRPGQGVEEKWGVPPERIVDVLALVGDSVDNIPGVAGIGDKGARDLVREFGARGGRARERGQGEAGRLPRGAARATGRTPSSRSSSSPCAPTCPSPSTSRRCGARSRTGPPPTPSSRSSSSRPSPRSTRPRPTPAAADHRAAPRREDDLEALVAEARPAGRVSRSASSAPRAEPMRAQAPGPRPRWARRAAPPTCPSATRRSTCRRPAAASEALERAAAAPRGRRRSASSRPTPSATSSLLGARRGARGAGWTFDALVASYLLDPGRRAYSLDDLAVEFVGERRAAGADGVAGAERVGRSPPARPRARRPSSSCA